MSKFNISLPSINWGRSKDEDIRKETARRCAAIAQSTAMLYRNPANGIIGQENAAGAEMVAFEIRREFGL